jgi:Cu+-exporting ATPase
MMGKEAPMQTGATESVEFVVPGLASEQTAIDLSNTLTALNGVGHVATDVATHVITVRYDVEYSNPSIIRHNIEGAGYEVSGEQ